MSISYRSGPVLFFGSLVVSRICRKFSKSITCVARKSYASVDSHVEIAISELRSIILSCLLSEKQPYDDAQICADTLMFAELRSNNQGVVKLLSGGLKGNPSSCEIKIVHESSVSARIDGGQRIGM